MPQFPIQKGSAAADVKAVQKLVQLQQNGIYGTTTTDFVRKFQQKAGLLATGVVDAQTWEALNKPLSNKIVLPVKYFTQRDSEVIARGINQAHRSCYSSSNAMLLEYKKPGTLPGSKGDDTYLRKVLTFGDTIDAEAQRKAMAHYNIKIRLVQNLNFEDIKAQIRKGNPVPIGILHKGPVTAPKKDGGHWIVCIGFDDKGLIVHDPYGDLNLVTGQYISTNGANRHYSYTNLKPRWCPKGNDGWGILLA